MIDFGFSDYEESRNSALIDQAAKNYFSITDYNFIVENMNSSDQSQRVFEMIRPFEEKLTNEFYGTITQEEGEALKNWFPGIDDIDGLREQCIEIIKEFRRGCYIRDVQINILGYESVNNVIDISE